MRKGKRKDIREMEMIIRNRQYRGINEKKRQYMITGEEGKKGEEEKKAKNEDRKGGK